MSGEMIDLLSRVKTKHRREPVSQQNQTSVGNSFDPSAAESFFFGV